MHQLEQLSEKLETISLNSNSAKPQSEKSAASQSTILRTPKAQSSRVQIFIDKENIPTPDSPSLKMRSTGNRTPLSSVYQKRALQKADKSFVIYQSQSVGQPAAESVKKVSVKSDKNTKPVKRLLCLR